MSNATDCQTCGACCGPSLDESAYVELSSADLWRLPAEFRRNHVRGASKGLAVLETKRDHNGTVCVALHGEIGRRVSCEIYGQRPQACRRFQPGSKECREARSEMGLSE